MLEEAARRAKLADHMLTMTYPLVKDPKLLLSVLENVHKSMDASLAAALMSAKEKGAIPSYPNSPEGRLATYQRYLSRTYKTPKELTRSLQEVRETLLEHAQSPVEFRRGGKFVICDEGYKVRTLSEEVLRGHVASAKALYSHVREVLV